jgi:hypothetical protein
LISRDARALLKKSLVWNLNIKKNKMLYLRVFDEKGYLRV